MGTKIVTKIARTREQRWRLVDQFANALRESVGAARALLEAEGLSFSTMREWELERGVEHAGVPEVRSTFRKALMRSLRSGS